VETNAGCAWADSLPDDSHLDAARQMSDTITDRASCTIQYE